MFKSFNFAASNFALILILFLTSSVPGTRTGAEQFASSIPTANQQRSNTQKTRSGRSTQGASRLDLTSFSAKGLNYEKELTGLYLGDFEHIRLERDSIEFSTIFGTYLNAFARQCRAYLPANKVEITRSECVQSQQPVNVYGAPVGPSTCIEYREVGTDLYADPDLYAAGRRVEAAATRNLVGKTFRGLVEKNAMGTALQAMDAMTSVGNDMALLLRINKCASPGLKRFEQNMKRFALGQPALRLAGGQTLASIGPPRPSQGSPFKDSNYTRMLDDLIVENSRAWMINRYVRGSVRDVKVTSRDRLGRPTKIFGRYQFNGYKGRAQGSVIVQFADGLPQCLYFFDNPNTCRSPSPRVITAYENGSYHN
jgi:hypothetical protein